MGWNDIQMEQRSYYRALLRRCRHSCSLLSLGKAGGRRGYDSVVYPEATDHVVELPELLVHCWKYAYYRILHGYILPGRPRCVADFEWSIHLAGDSKSDVHGNCFWNSWLVLQCLPDWQDSDRK